MKACTLRICISLASASWFLVGCNLGVTTNPQTLERRTNKNRIDARDSVERGSANQESGTKNNDSRTENGSSDTPGNQDNVSIPPPPSTNTGQPGGTKDAAELIEKGAAAINREFITSELSYLSSDALQGRLTGSDGNRTAANHIAEKFRSFGLEPGGTGGTSYLQNFSVNHRRTNGTVRTDNIIGILPGNGRSDEIIVLGAHMDHIGTTGNEIYNGADDNASGTVAILAAAKALAPLKSLLDRDIVIMAFSGEELGLLGSSFFLQNPTIPKDKIAYMLNLDMVGYGEGRVYGIRFDGLSAIQGLLTERANRYEIDVLFDNSKDGASDHVPFARAGIIATVFHTGLHTNYHEVTDTEEKIDLDSLLAISKLTFDLIANAANMPNNFFARSLTLRSNSTHSKGMGLHGQILQPFFWDEQEVADFIHSH